MLLSVDSVADFGVADSVGPESQSAETDRPVFWLNFGGSPAASFDGPEGAVALSIPPFSVQHVGGLTNADAASERIAALVQSHPEMANVDVVVSRPNSGSYSTIHIGGTNAAFSESGTFLGLAESVDVGNRLDSDEAFVFSDSISAADVSGENWMAAVAGIAVHEAGHLLGVAHSAESLGGDVEGGLADVAFAIDHAGGGGNPVHEYLSQQGYMLFEHQFGQTAMTDHVEWFINGTRDEDEPGQNPYGQGGFNHPSVRHFWDPDGGLTDGLGTSDSAVNRAVQYLTGGYGFNGLADGVFIIGDWGDGPSRPGAGNAVVGEGAASLYDVNDETAFYYLGHMAHLLQDMSVPAHVHKDAHLEGFGALDAPDPFHDWVDGRAFITDEDTADAAGRPQASFDDPAGSRWLNYSVPIESEVSSMIRTAEELGGERVIQTFNVGPFEALFTEAAELTDDYDSSEGTGEVDDRDRATRLQGGLLDFDYYDDWSRDDLHELAGILVPDAIQNSADLIRAFFGTVDTGEDSEPMVAFSEYRDSTAESPSVVRTTSIDLNVLASDADSGDSGVGRDLFRFRYQVRNPTDTEFSDWMEPDENWEGWTAENGLPLAASHFGEGEADDPEFADTYGAAAMPVFNGEAGATYRFEVTAVDGAGNEAVTEAWVTIGGIDLVFVIDTTGSMSDDIAAVKVSATEIVNEILSEDSDETRVGIVLYRDHGDAYVSRTQLPMTSDRDAVVAAINSITVAGGGDFPEAVFSGLIHAIDHQGGLGGWNSDGTPKKIIVMGDAPPHDPEPGTGYTSAFVAERAAAGGVEIGGSAGAEAPVFADPGTLVTAWSSHSVPVDIFTITIGSNSSALSAFEQIAENNRGVAFRASGSDDIVATILDVVDSIDEGGDAGVIEGRKWEDGNANGVHDPGERWLNNWSVELRDTEGNLVATVVTGDLDRNGDGMIDPATESGWYRFESVADGDYVVMEEMRVGWEQSYPANPIMTAAYELDRDENLRLTENSFLNWGGMNEKWLLGDAGWFYIIPDGGVYKWNGGGPGELSGVRVAALTSEYYSNPELLTAAPEPPRHEVSVTAGVVAAGIDFGNYGTGVIAGRKWYDFNRSGTHEAGESWLNGWEVRLINDADGTVAATTTTTDIDLNSDGIISPETERGHYRFDRVPPGSYRVEEVLNPDWVQTYPHDPAAMTAYELNESLGLEFSGNDFRNWGGLGERWLQGGDGAWFYITPTGSLYRWNGGGPGGLEGEKAGTLSPAYHEDLSLLTDATEPEPRVYTITDQDVFNDAHFANYRIAVDGCHGDPDPSLVPGDVRIFAVGPDWYISGDAYDNQVAVFTDNYGSVVAIGLQGTTLNGSQAPVVLSSAGMLRDDLRIGMAGGNDLLCLSGFSVGDDLEIDTGAGTDTVLLGDVWVSGDFRLMTGTGDSLVGISNVTVGDDLVYQGGNQTDRLAVAGLTTGDRTLVSLFGGDDRILIRSADLSGLLSVSLGSGNDVVIGSGADFSAGAASVSGGAGFDAVDGDDGFDTATEGASFSSIESDVAPDRQQIIDEVLADLAVLGIDALLFTE